MHEDDGFELRLCIIEGGSERVNVLPLTLQYPYLAWFDLWGDIAPQIEHYSQLLIREQGIALELLEADIEKNKKMEEKKKKKTSRIQSEIDTFCATLHPPSEEKLIEQPVRTPARRARGPSREDWTMFLRVLDAYSQKTPWLTSATQVLKKDMNTYDVEQATSHAKQTHKTAQTMWWQIPIERNLGQPLGMEEARWEDSYSVVPTLRGEHSLLSNWLNLLPPRLKTIFISSLS